LFWLVMKWWRHGWDFEKQGMKADQKYFQTSFLNTFAELFKN
jgi:hypothetical protein